MFPSNNKLAKELSTKYPVIPNNPQDQIDTLNTKLDAHLAESASKHIKESGSNANGRYIKFDDGTMICFATVTANFTLLSQDFTLPATFTQVISAAFSIRASTSSPTTVVNRAQAYLNVTNGYWRLLTGQSDTATALTVGLFAIGRWK